LTGLREIPTGISLPSSTAAVVAHRLDDDANHVPQPCPSLSPTMGLTISSPSPTLQGSNASLFDARSTKHPSSINITILREIPTRNSLHNSLDAIVDPLDHDDDDRNTQTTTTKHPTNVEGNAAPLPYQLELAAISATIELMKQRDNNITPQTHSPPQQPFDTQSERVEMSAALARLKIKLATVLPQLTECHPLTTQCMHDPSLNDTNGHPNDEQSSLSITDMFILQTKMMRNISMMLVELKDTVALILDAILLHSKNSSIPNRQSALLLPLTTPTTIGYLNAFQPQKHAPITQIPPWPPHHNPCNKIAPGSKFSPYQQHIPAKPPFNCGRNTRHLVKTRKDSMRPP